MKNKFIITLTWAFSVIPFFSTFFQAIIEQNILVLCSIYLGILFFLIVELFISAFEISTELLYIIPNLFIVIIPIVAIKSDLFRIRFEQRKIHRLEKKINVLSSKLNSLKNK